MKHVYGSFILTYKSDNIAGRTFHEEDIQFKSCRTHQALPFLCKTKKAKILILKSLITMKLAKNKLLV